MIVKLRNDFDLLNEVLAEEKEKNGFLENQIKILEFKLNSTQSENDNLLKKIEYLEDQLSKTTDELSTTKQFYEELVSNLQSQLTCQYFKKKKLLKKIKQIEQLLN